MRARDRTCGCRQGRASPAQEPDLFTVVSVGKTAYESCVFLVVLIVYFTNIFTPVQIDTGFCFKAYS